MHKCVRLRHQTKHCTKNLGDYNTSIWNSDQRVPIFDQLLHPPFQFLSTETTVNRTILRNINDVSLASD